MLLVATVATLAHVPAASAAGEPGSFTVAPLKVQMDLDPGQSATGTIRVFTKEAGERYEIGVGDVTQNDDGSYNYLDVSGRPDDVSAWLAVKPASFRSGPGAVEPITWTVRVPDEADPGDHLGAVYVTQLATPKAGTVVLQARIAVRMEFRVRGDIDFRPQIERVTVPRLSSGGPVPVKVVVANRGNVRVDLRKASTASVRVLDGGRVLETFRLVPADKDTPVVLFPGAVRTFSFSWKHPPRFGQFTAEARIAFDEGETQADVRRSARVTVAPYRAVGGLAVIGLGALLIGGYLALGKRREQRGPKEA